MAVFLLFSLAVAGPAMAHHELHTGVGSYGDGRIPGEPDFERVAGATWRYLPGIHEYEYNQRREPPVYYHYHAPTVTSPNDVAYTTEAGGAATKLPESELEPVCRTNGHRIVVVYTHRLTQTAPTPTATLRSVIRRMNWKIADQSNLSSSGSRIVRMVVDCDEGGNISVYNVATSSDSPQVIRAAVEEQLFGDPNGPELGLRYLLFDTEVGNFAGLLKDSAKSTDSTQTSFTLDAFVWQGSAEKQTSIHELFHTFGATQSQATVQAPFSGYPSGHCIDGIDVMCYYDGGTYQGETFSETRCPEAEGYATPTGLPIDCGNDTYFDAAPLSDSWLAENWNVAGPENPFLVALPKAASESPSSVGATSAVLEGSLNPEGYNVKYWFDYGPTEAYGSSTAPESVTFGSSTRTVNAAVNGLSPSLTYHFRLAAESDSGVVYGKDMAFAALPTAHVVSATGRADGITTSGATVHGSINPEGIGTTYVFDYGPTTSYGAKAPVTPKSAGSGTTTLEVSEQIEGLAAGTTYHYRLTANTGEYAVSGADRVFSTPSLPSATTQGFTGLKAREATLTGSVNPEESGTSYYFEYGPTTAYGSSIPPSAKWVGIAAANIEVSQRASLLVEGTTYHYRLVAVNEAGTAHGSDKTFTTLRRPKATTENATAVKATQVALNGVINPEGSTTSYYFEYGPTTSYGSKIPTSPKAAGSGTSNVAVSETLSGLTEHSTYHYRLVAESQAATTKGKDLTVTTPFAQSGEITEYSIPKSSCPNQIAAGPDGNLWFTEFCKGTIARFTPNGSLNEYSAGVGNPTAITQGPDGNMWFTGGSLTNARVGRITTAGVVTNYAIGASGQPLGIVTGPDGNLWFSTNTRKVGKITPAGVVTEYNSLASGHHSADIVSGPDGNLWVADGTSVWRVTTQGVGTQISVPNGNIVRGLAVGPGGKIWFTVQTSAVVGTIDPGSGAVTEYSLPDEPAQRIAAGPDGNLWITLYKRIGRVTTSGTTTEYTLANGKFPAWITVGPDGNMWFTINEENAKIGKITP